MARAYLGIGSNLGDRLGHLQAAVDGLAAESRITVTAVSPVYETEPVGGSDQPEYLNAVVAVETDLAPRQLLEAGQAIEAHEHRVRAERWGPRTLDVDVLLVGEQAVEEPDLVVPHPRTWERAFVVVPLAAVAPELADDVARATPPGGFTGIRATDLTLVVPEQPDQA